MICTSDQKQLEEKEESLRRRQRPPKKRWEYVSHMWNYRCYIQQKCSANVKEKERDSDTVSNKIVFRVENALVFAPLSLFLLLRYHSYG